MKKALATPFRPLKVLLVGIAYYPGVAAGGPLAVMRECAQALQAQGQEVFVLVTNTDTRKPLSVPVDKDTVYQGVKVRYCTSPRWHYYGFSPAMRHWLRKNLTRFDVVQVHSVFNFPQLYVMRYAIANHHPFILMPHGAASYFTSKLNFFIKKFFIFLFRSALSKAASFHYTSQNEKQQSLLKVFPSVPEVTQPTFMAKHQVSSRTSSARPPQALKQTFRKHGALTRRFLLFAGRLHRIKRVDLIVEAFILLAARFPKLDLILAGPDEEGLAEGFKRRLRQTGLLARVFFAGLLSPPELQWCYRHASLFLLPSEHENFSYATAEALQAELPVITSRAVDLTNVFPELSALVPKCDFTASSLAKQIQLSLENYPKHKKAARQLRQLLLKRFAAERVSKQLLELYRSAAEQRLSAG